MLFRSRELLSLMRLVKIDVMREILEFESGAKQAIFMIGYGKKDFVFDQLSGVVGALTGMKKLEWLMCHERPCLHANRHG